MATKTKTSLDECWERAWELYSNPSSEAGARSAQRAAVVEVLKLADGVDAIEDDEARRHIRREAEELLLKIDAKGSAADKKRAQAKWHAFAKRRIDEGALGELFGLAIVMKAVGIEKLHDDVAGAFKRGWAAQRIRVMGNGISTGEKTSWSATAAPTDPLEAYACAREAYRKERWGQVIACAKTVEAAKGLIAPPWTTAKPPKQARITSAQTRDMIRLMLLVALLKSGAPDQALVRETVTLWTSRKSHGGSREDWMMPFGYVAAVIIAYDVGSQPGDAKVVSAYATLWDRSKDWHASPALLR